jgi:RHS repeat-associated protein
VAADADVPGLTRTEYDSAGRVKASVYQAGAVDKWRTTSAYDGDRVHVTPAAGGTAITTISDPRGRTTELRQYQGATPDGAYDSTFYRYDPAGHLSEVTAPGNVTWKFGYDLRGNKIRSEDPDSGVSTMTYDNAGRLESTRDGRNVTVAYKYDSLSRKTELHRDDLNGPKLAQWVYDTARNGKGKLASSTRYVGALAYTASVGSYSPLYQPDDSTITIPAAPGLGLLAGSYTWFGTYGQDGVSLSNETYPAVGGLSAETVNYVQDDAGRPLSSSGGYDGETVELATATNYTRYGEVERVQLGAAKRTWLSYYFDSHTRKLERSIVDTEAPKPMQSDVRYAYDDAGFATTVAEAAPGQTDTQCFRHDSLGRMTEVWTPTAACTAAPAVPDLGGVAPYWHSYRYDASGNRNQEIRHTAAGDSTISYTYPDPGRPQPHILRSVSGAGRTESYAYDAGGYTTGRTKAGANETFNWDAEGHLESVKGPSGTTSFLYNADGGRLLRTDPAGSTLYLGNQEVRLAASGGDPVATRYYTYAGKAIAARTGAKLTWLGGDQRAEQLSIDSQTMEVTRRRQLPFGEPRAAVPAFWPDERGFVGGTRDPSTGLTHLGAREYDTSTGRFISVDPVLDVSDPQQMNGYAYGNNNPSTFADATGLRSCGIDGEDCHMHQAENTCGGPACGPNGVINPGGDRHSGGRHGGTYRNNPTYREPGPPPRTGCGGRGMCAPNGTLPVTAKPKPTCTGGSGYGTQTCHVDPCGPGMHSYEGYSGRQGCVENGHLSSEDSHTGCVWFHRHTRSVPAL